jgi:tetratricopeptide (TPR) repeat protein
MERADAFYLQAIQSFNEGRYRDALESFDRAIALRPDPVFFCNRGTVLLKLNEIPSALASMESCLERFEADDEESRTERAQIQAEVLALSLVVRQVSPKVRRIATNIATRPDDKEATVVFVQPRDSSRRGMRIGAWSMAGVAGASIVSSLIVEASTQPLIEEFKEAGAAGQDRGRFDALRAAIDQRKVVIGGLLILGAASTITSAVLFWADIDAEDQSSGPNRIGAALNILENGAAIELKVAF